MDEITPSRVSSYLLLCSEKKESHAGLEGREEAGMSADNVLLLFTLLWTFTAVCQADEEISLSCDDVTGSVGKEVTLSCSVSLPNADCCIDFFKYYEMYEGSVICMNWFLRDSCEHRSSFTCSYTPTTATTAMTEQFRFFVQTACGVKGTEFTVDFSELSIRETDPEAPDETGPAAEIIVITGVSCLIFIIFIIVIVTCVKRLKNTNASGSQTRRERAASEEQTAMTTNV